MAYSLSNLILLFPIACGLAVVLAMTGGLTTRARPDVMRTFVRILVWQLLMLALIGLVFRMTLLHILWLFLVIAFAIQTLFWEYGLARNTVMLVWLSAEEVPEDLASVAHYLKREGRGYWRRLGKRLWDGLHKSGDWLIAGRRADTSTSSPGGKSSYSLLLLFYLMTLAAILIAVCRMATDNSQLTVQAFARGTIVFGVLGLILGITIGFIVARRAVGPLLGAIVGMGTGLAATFMVLADPIHFANMAVLVAAGCWLVAVIAVVANRLQNE